MVQQAAQKPELQLGRALEQGPVLVPLRPEPARRPVPAQRPGRAPEQLPTPHLPPDLLHALLPDLVQTPTLQQEAQSIPVQEMTPGAPGWQRAHALQCLVQAWMRALRWPWRRLPRWRLRRPRRRPSWWSSVLAMAQALFAGALLLLWAAADRA